MTAQDPSECKHYYPELKACKYQEELATTYGEGIRIMVCERDKCEYFTPKNDTYYEKIEKLGRRIILRTNCAPELIDALKSLLIWCLKNGYVNSNTDKK